MRVVVALGGNALLRRGEPADPANQRANVATVVAAIAELARDHQIVVTHGNGPPGRASRAAERVAANATRPGAVSATDRSRNE